MELMHKRTSNKCFISTKYFCPFCNDNYNKKGNVIKHLREKHTEQEGLDYIKKIEEGAVDGENKRKFG